MSRRAAVAIIAGALVLAVALLIVGRRDETPKPVTEPQPDLETVELPDDVEGTPVEIYFPDRYGTLTAEAREVLPWSTPEEGAQILLRALFAGPGDPELAAPLPAEAGLGTVHLAETGVLYVDIVSTELSRPPSTGSQEELLAIWSLVDTVVLGVPEIVGVVLTWNSRQLTSFGGHVDTTLPLGADPDLIRAQR